MHMEMNKKSTNLSVLKGDLPDEWDTFVLGPGVAEVKVGQGAQEHHVRNRLSHRLEDDVVSAEALRL